MRVGIDAAFLRKPGTGIGQVATHFLRSISENANVEYILYLEAPIDDALDIPKHFHRRVVIPPWRRDDLVRLWWRERFTLPRVAAEDGCDVFLSLSQSATIMPRRIRHVMIVHDSIPALFPEYLDNARKRFHWQRVERGIRSANRIIAVSSRTEKDLIATIGVPASRITVNPIDVDPIFRRVVTEEHLAEVLRKYHLSPGYLYHGGGLETRKNTENVLLAYRRILDRAKRDHSFGPVPPLVISGRLLPQLAPLITDVERRVRELDLGTHVRILDFVPQGDLPALYRGAIAFLFPSRYEGFGMPVLEAMCIGTPVITSKRSSLPEVGGDAVLYTDPDDVDDLAMVIRNMLSNQTLRETMRARGRNRAMRFSWKTFTDKLLRIVVGQTFV